MTKKNLGKHWPCGKCHSLWASEEMMSRRLIYSEVNWVWEHASTSVMNETHKKILLGLLGQSQNRITAFQRWENGRLESGCTFIVPSDNLFIFVIGLMMKIHDRMWMMKMKWAHETWKTKDHKLFFIFSFFFSGLHHSSGMLLFLIRCTT